jgi:hypothetical protein
LFEAGPGIEAGTFVFELQALAAFCGSCAQTPPRRS